MLPAAFRFFAFGALVLNSAEGLRAAETNYVRTANAAGPVSAPANAAAAPRASPSRPSVAGPAAPMAPSPRVSLHVGAVEYVSATDIAIWLGLKGAWTEPARKLVLTDKSNSAHQLGLEVNGRTALVDGLWVHLGHATVFRSGHLYVSRTDLERCLAPMMRPQTCGPVLARPRVIALDPGHGGGDPGMENKLLGLQEKVLSLDVAFRVKKLLEAGGFVVVMTRTDDRTFSPEKKTDLPMRAEFANRNQADLFLSIHFNSLFPDTKTKGAEIYVYTPQGQRSTQSWGAGEADDAKREVSPVNRYDEWSALLAHRMHRAVIGNLNTPDRGQKTKHLLVFQNLNCPAVLVESLFLSNPVEARRAATVEYRQQIAEALAAGIREYVATLDALRSKSPTASTTTALRRASSSS